MNYSHLINIKTGTPPLRYAGTALALVLAVMFPVGIAGMASGMLPREYLWTTSLFLGLQATLTFVLLWTESSFVRAVVVTVAIGAAATVVEFIGLATGFPFGSYYYSYSLEPFVVSNVPLAIVFAWYILVVNIVLLSGPETRGPAAAVRKILAGGFIFMGIDILLEPFASFVNRYWTWAGGVIPLQNYAAWFVLGTLLIAATQYMLRTRKPSPSGGGVRIPVLLLGMTAAQCMIINGLNGYWIPTITGIAIITAASWSLRHDSV